MANPCYVRKFRGREISGYRSSASASAFQLLTLGVGDSQNLDFRFLTLVSPLEPGVGLQLLRFRFLTAVTPPPPESGVRLHFYRFRFLTAVSPSPWNQWSDCTPLTSPGTLRILKRSNFK